MAVFQKAAYHKPKMAMFVGGNPGIWAFPASHHQPPAPVVAKIHQPQTAKYRHSVLSVASM